ncbi:hypothetical protein FKP32DRAFT_1680520 [Trametes sanguinea]|nr:hypothetical protein FKP32DRAFT_1680520 [Trametes sanguinea]
MAFFLADKDTLCRDLWPENVGQVVQERSLSVADLPEYRKVPEDAEDLAEWLWVDRQDALAQALVYVYTDTDVDEPEELVVRLQGVISQANLAVGGNWDGTEINAKKATQQLVLTSGGCDAAFDPQVRVLKTLREAVLAQLGCCEDVGAARQDAIVMRKRVFTKIRPGVNDHLHTIVRDEEDPRGRFKAIVKQWRPTERLRAGTQLAHGEVFYVNPLSLRKGDFVDVSARIVVAYTRGPQGRRYELSLEPILIVRLAAPMQFQRLVRPPRTLTAQKTALGDAKQGRVTMAFGFKMVEPPTDDDESRMQE